MNRFRNSVLAGIAAILILLWGIWLGYTLTPPNIIYETEYIHETIVVVQNVTRTEYVPVSLNYTINTTTSIVLTLTVLTNLTIDIYVTPHVGNHTLDMHTYYYPQWSVTYANFETWSWFLTSDIYFFNHTLHESCQVEYFLY